MLESAVRIVTAIFLMIGAGYLFQRKGWLGENAPVILSRVTLRIGMPGLIFSNILSEYSRDMLLDGAVSLLAPLIVLTVMYMLSMPIAKALRIPSARRGVFRALFTFGNTLFIGMPVCRAIFGEAGVSSVLLYYLVNTSLWWLIGAPGVAGDGGAGERGGFLKRLASP
ncbi:MAG: AEC family transporter, partial [Firmicutes bacterium]|nr:AEC family transporter [Bacillota bacterium]